MPVACCAVRAWGYDAALQGCRAAAVPYAVAVCCVARRASEQSWVRVAVGLARDTDDGCWQRKGLQRPGVAWQAVLGMYLGEGRRADEEGGVCGVCWDHGMLSVRCGLGRMGLEFMHVTEVAVPEALALVRSCLVVAGRGWRHGCGIARLVVIRPQAQPACCSR